MPRRGCAGEPRVGGGASPRQHLRPPEWGQASDGHARGTDRTARAEAPRWARTRNEAAQRHTRAAQRGGCRGRPLSQGEVGSPVRGLRGAVPRLSVCWSRLTFLTADLGSQRNRGAENSRPPACRPAQPAHCQPPVGIRVGHALRWTALSRHVVITCHPQCTSGSLLVLCAPWVWKGVMTRVHHDSILQSTSPP